MLQPLMSQDGASGRHGPLSFAQVERLDHPFYRLKNSSVSEVLLLQETEFIIRCGGSL